MTSDSTEFSWHDCGDDLVVPEQQAVAVFWNPRGELVIRQKADFYPDEDHYVIVHPGNIRKLAHRLLLEADSLEDGADEQPKERLALAPPKDPTATERQRRHRQRQRDGLDRDTRDTSVTGTPNREDELALTR
jgi:hypothetical protein